MNSVRQDLDLKSGPAIWQSRPNIPLDFFGPDQPYDRALTTLLRHSDASSFIVRVAETMPDKIVVDDGRLTLSFRELMAHSYELCKLLTRATPVESALVALVRNSSICPIIILACGLSGRTLIAIDASHPQERQAAIFAESGAAAVLLAEDETVDHSFIPNHIPRLVVRLSAEPSEGAVVPAQTDDSERPLFVCFTSGSTGQPKGLAMGGRSGGEALGQYIDMFHVRPSDVILGLASLSTGGSRDAFAALCAGAKIRIVDLLTGGFAEVLRVLARDSVTILSFVPSVLRTILSIDGAENSFRSLRILDLHGERVLTSDLALFRSKLPADCHISVTMGSMEAGAVFSWFVRDDMVEGSVVPVGYPLPGRQVALLDEAGKPVPIGEVGELFVRGDLALGAWREGRLVPGPFLTDPKDPRSRIYAMGDLLRRRSDGLFEYVGRRDRRTKIRGLWADLGEVEAAIRTVAGVSDVVVAASGGTDEAEQLVAFIAVQAGTLPPSASHVSRIVAAATAAHMVPARLSFVEAIPKLAGFKPDVLQLMSGVDGSDQSFTGRGDAPSSF